MPGLAAERNLPALFFGQSLHNGQAHARARKFGSGVQSLKHVEYTLLKLGGYTEPIIGDANDVKPIVLTVVDAYFGRGAPIVFEAVFDEVFEDDEELSLSYHQGGQGVGHFNLSFTISQHGRQRSLYLCDEVI